MKLCQLKACQSMAQLRALHMVAEKLIFAPFNKCIFSAGRNWWATRKRQEEPMAFVSFLDEMAALDLSLSLSESSFLKVPPLGSWQQPQDTQSFPNTPLYQEGCVRGLSLHNKVFASPKRFAVLYLMEQDFNKTWSMTLVDAAASYLDKKLTCPVDNVPVNRMEKIYQIGGS